MEPREVVEMALDVVHSRRFMERRIPPFKQTLDELDIVIDGLLDLYNLLEEEEPHTEA